MKRGSNSDVGGEGGTMNPPQKKISILKTSRVVPILEGDVETGGLAENGAAVTGKHESRGKAGVISTRLRLFWSSTSSHHAFPFVAPLLLLAVLVVPLVVGCITLAHHSHGILDEDLAHWWLTLALVASVAVPLLTSTLLMRLLLVHQAHQTLLHALLPSVCQDDEGMDSLDAGTPADKILALLADILQGRKPLTRDVIFIQHAIQEAHNIYEPVDLRQRIIKNFGSDVARSVMAQLGRSTEQEADACNPDAADDDIDPVTGNRVMLWDSKQNNREGGDGDDGDDDDRGDGDDADKGDSEDGEDTPLMSCRLGLEAILVPGVNLGLGMIGSGTRAVMRSANKIKRNGIEMGSGSRGSAVTGSGRGGLVRRKDTATDVLIGDLYDNLEDLDFFTSAGVGSMERTGFLSAPTPVCPAIITKVESVLSDAACSWTFDAFLLDDVSEGHSLSTIGFFLLHQTGLLRRFRLPTKPLVSPVFRFLRKIELGYEDNPYHNRIHAADVLQTFNVILTRGGLTPHYADPLTHLACLLAAIVHDYEHKGLTNDYLINSSDDLAILYNDRSPMENHHLAAAFQLLKSAECNFLQDFSRNEMTTLRKVMIDLVLGTDMKQHFSITSQFTSMHRMPSMSNLTDSTKAPSHRMSIPGNIDNLGMPTKGGALKRLASVRFAADTTDDVGSALNKSRIASATGIESNKTTDKTAHFKKAMSLSRPGHAITAPPDKMSLFKRVMSTRMAAAGRGGSMKMMALSPESHVSTAPPDKLTIFQRVKSLHVNGGGSMKVGAMVDPSHEGYEMKPIDEAERMLSLQMALKCADLGHLAETLAVNIQWVGRLENEFFGQGDKESMNGLPISPLFDRNKPGISRSQVGFFAFVVLPLFQNFTRVFKLAEPMYHDGVLSNYEHWSGVENAATAKSAVGPS